MVVPLLTILTFVASLLVVAVSANWIIRASSNLAKQFGVSTYFIGFTIIAVGTSLPEMVTGVFASLADQGNLVLGNVLGANLLNATVVIGLAAIIGRKINIGGRLFKTFDETLLMSLGILIVPFLIGMDGVLSRGDGILLVVVFAFYVGKLYESVAAESHRKNIIWGQLVKDFIFLAIAIPALLLGAHFFVGAASSIATGAGLSVFIIGLTIVSIGTTLPEMVVQLTSVLKHKGSVGFGDSIGSILSNITLVLGVAAIIRPIVFEPSLFLTAASFMFMATFVALLFLHRRAITWKEGLALILIYVTFLVSEVFLLA
ncbi:sodium:calcium antiporter [Thermoproteota archaeon]